MRVNKEMLPPYCKQLQEEYGIHIGQVAKLIPTLADKKNYVSHLRKFQLYLRLGLKLKKVHHSGRAGQKILLRNPSENHIDNFICTSGGLGPLLSPLIVLFCFLFPGGVRILVKSTRKDRISWKFFFRLTPNSPCFRQLKRFTAQKTAHQHSTVRNNMDLSFIVDDFWLQKVI